ncbi:MAG: GNAT family N-acetyltransferase [Cyclobacteriaceae bacterium]
MEIRYKSVNQLDHIEFLELLTNSTLAERRPVHDEAKIRGMCENANLIIEARENGRLVGIARSITDFHYCTYLSDLAVDSSFQKSGIGKELINRTKAEAPGAMLILLSAPTAVGFYEKIKMRRYEGCFVEGLSRFFEHPLNISFKRHWNRIATYLI